MSDRADKRLTLEHGRVSSVLVLDVELGLLSLASAVLVCSPLCGGSLLALLSGKAVESEERCLWRAVGVLLSVEKPKVRSDGGGGASRTKQRSAWPLCPLEWVNMRHEKCSIHCSSPDETSCAFRFLLEHVWVVRVVDREPGRVHARVRARSLRLVDEDLSVQRLERGSGELSERGTC